MQNQFIDLLKGKWSANSSILLDSIPIDHRQLRDIIFDHPDNTLKILGLQWRAHNDVFVFTINAISSTRTKRSILSQIDKIMFR